MNINRHNYEEFFILYMDKELSSEDRRMVEDFVQHHPDLKEELELLMQYKLVPDELVVFENKETLIKGDAIINVANYEEYFLSYIDDELTTAQKAAVEKFVADNPVAAKELTLLQKSKLQPEDIVFANKESLYRSEEKIRRLPVKWWRAAAAVLILALGLTTFLVLKKKSSTEIGPIVKTPGSEQNNPVVNTVEQPPKETLVADVNEKQNPGVANPEESNNIQQAVAPEKKSAIKNMDVANAILTPKNLPAKQHLIPSKKDEQALITAIVPPVTNNNLPQPISNPNFSKNDAANNAIANVNIPKEIKKVEALTNPVVTTKSTQPSNYSNASFIEEESQQNEKKNKLRGFFRKITRTLEKRTNIDATDDDGKLLIAGLAIKLK
ncbi:MAG: hypothetical protein IPN82_07580 [Chitinophagaceae bacterium]|nr:hypothetical protein [Chitinophagaceae bacterium]MBK8606687.1 hypothetical protein [Chitinophagaceae bacterium]MBP6477575.1 hypothetical protein [Chitinophagaceae bacterium]MBP7107950.1 hypothetical protein [Chitinophagaceae bacterium]MBP7314032.1 hypothetical protein [Chitinophagaceae bacterium]